MKEKREKPWPNPFERELVDRQSRKFFWVMIVVVAGCAVVGFGLKTLLYFFSVAQQ